VNLMQAVDEYHKQHPEEWATPAGALNQCTDASYHFVQFLRAHNIKADIISLWMDDFEYEGQAKWYEGTYKLSEYYPRVGPGSTMSQGHCIVKSGKIAIDWTARQYNKDAPYPLIFEMRE